ncbi:hypothetical protein SAMN04515671_0087 [Nakamurella panacisegetis]|uniref:Uncharacterized protein n=1 Tax=Nakamurella panacisegetis TaxID=1090615 RepID=A0A1H0HIH8_9ACTN|nr:hypothetical protein [Nakamurella panacisegetis]SDO19005.1 hypothetical protein SAMN04515671_0087 [Nakamurella panacisegetis]
MSARRFCDVCDGKTVWDATNAATLTITCTTCGGTVSGETLEYAAVANSQVNVLHYRGCQGTTTIERPDIFQPDIMWSECPACHYETWRR